MKDVMVGSVGTQQGDTYVGNAAALDCDSSVVNVNVTPSAVKNTSVRPTLAAFFKNAKSPLVCDFFHRVHSGSVIRCFAVSRWPNPT